MRIKILYILIFVILTGCGSKSVSFKKARKLYLNKDFKTFLNKEVEIELDKYFLDSENIINIIADKKVKH